MVTTAPLTTDQFLEWSKALEHPYELVDGIPTRMTPERYLNTLIARYLARKLESIFNFEQLAFSVEIEVRPGNTRIPDLCVVSEDTAKALIEQSRAIIRLGMEPPLIAVEVVSPSSGDRDNTTKLAEYAEIGISEYWIIDPDKEAAKIYQVTPDGEYKTVAESALATLTVDELIAITAMTKKTRTAQDCQN